MNATKLDKIKRQIAACRRKANTHRDLEAIAKSLKRKLFNRGKEHTYVNTVFPDLRPLSIPNHAGRTIAPGTAHNILDSLEEDVYRFEEQLEKEKHKNRRATNYENGEDRDEN